MNDKPRAHNHGIDWCPEHVQPDGTIQGECLAGPSGPLSPAWLQAVSGPVRPSPAKPKPVELVAQARAEEDHELLTRAVIALAREWGVSEDVARLRLSGVVEREWRRPEAYR
ncbi:hypothetical protein [Actinotalea sp.]|uniref:hypothetical protein n=1 Tax=Actinotalea sp. TaxID=1872145 RepID=UPI0035689168